MYRINPLGEQLLGCKPKSLLPDSKSALQSKHSDNNAHQEPNMQKQTKQTDFYNRKPSCDKRILNNSEWVYVWNFQKHTPMRSSTVQIVAGNQEHTLLKWMTSYNREQESICYKVLPTVPKERHPIPIFPQVTLDAEFNQLTANRQQSTTPAKVPKPVVSASNPNPVVPWNSVKPRPETEVVIVKGEVLFQPKSQITRSGWKTQVPEKFKD